MITQILIFVGSLAIFGVMLVWWDRKDRNLMDMDE